MHNKTIIIRSSNHSGTGKNNNIVRPYGISNKKDCLFFCLTSLFEIFKQYNYHDKFNLIICHSGYDKELLKLLLDYNISNVEVSAGDQGSQFDCLTFIKNILDKNEWIYLGEDDYLYHPLFFNEINHAINLYEKVAITPYVPHGLINREIDLLDNPPKISYEIYRCCFVNFAMKSLYWKQEIDGIVSAINTVGIENYMNENVWCKKIRLMRPFEYNGMHFQLPDYIEDKKYYKHNDRHILE